MAIPKLFKSVPLLATAGTVGVGGTVLAVTNSKSSNKADKPADNSQPQVVIEEPHTSEPLPSGSRILLPLDSSKTDSAFQLKIPKFEDWSPEKAANLSSLDKDTDDFQFGFSGCYNKMFPVPSPKFSGMNISMYQQVVEEQLKIKPSNAKEPDAKSSGCAAMQLVNNGKEFLFRSEMSFKTENTGMILWTGIKSVNAPAGIESQSGLYLSAVQYLVLLDGTKAQGGSTVWKIKLALSWGAQSDSPINVKSLTIKDPNGNTLGKKIDETTTDSGNYSFVGAWEKGETEASFPFTSEADPYKTDDSNKDLEISSNKIKGYKEVRYAKYDNFSTHWQFQVVSKEEEELPDEHSTLNNQVDVSETFDAWFEHFKDIKGSWKTMDDYCRGKEELKGEERSNSFCFVMNLGASNFAISNE